MPVNKEKKAAQLREWRARNRDHCRAEARKRYNTPEGYAYHESHRLKSTYGITLEKYNEMLSQQGGLCFICGNPETGNISTRKRTLVVDHDHGTGKVRKLLCTNCNRGLGGFGDNTILMERAIRYIKDHQ